MSRLRFAGAGHWHFRFRHCSVELESRRAEPANILGILAFLRLSASSTAHARFSFRGNSERLGAPPRGYCFPAAVVHSGGLAGSVCFCVDFPLLRRTQSSRFIRSPVVVLACRSKNGGAGSNGTYESGSAAVYSVRGSGNVTLNISPT